MCVLFVSASPVVLFSAFGLFVKRRAVSCRSVIYAYPVTYTHKLNSPLRRYTSQPNWGPLKPVATNDMIFQFSPMSRSSFVPAAHEICVVNNADEGNSTRQSTFYPTLFSGRSMLITQKHQLEWMAMRNIECGPLIFRDSFDVLEDDVSDAVRSYLSTAVTAVALQRTSTEIKFPATRPSSPLLSSTASTASTTLMTPPLTPPLSPFLSSRSLASSVPPGFYIDHHFRNIGYHFPKLTTLQIMNPSHKNWAENQADLPLMLHSLKTTLRSFSLAGQTSMIHADGFASVFRPASSCDAHDGTILSFMHSTAVSSSLSVLHELSLPHAITRIHDLLAFLNTCPHLRILNLWNYGGRGLSTSIPQSFPLTDQYLHSVASTCPHLVFLNLGWCNQITRAGLAALLTACHHLRYVAIADCPLITENDIEWLDDQFPMAVLTSNMSVYEVALSAYRLSIGLGSPLSFDPLQASSPFPSRSISSRSPSSSSSSPLPAPRGVNWYDHYFRYGNPAFCQHCGHHTYAVGSSKSALLHCSRCELRACGHCYSSPSPDLESTRRLMRSCELCEESFCSGCAETLYHEGDKSCSTQTCHALYCDKHTDKLIECSEQGCGKRYCSDDVEAGDVITPCAAGCGAYICDDCESDRVSSTCYDCGGVYCAACLSKNDMKFCPLPGCKRMICEGCSVMLPWCDADDCDVVYCRSHTDELIECKECGKHYCRADWKRLGACNCCSAPMCWEHMQRKVESDYGDDKQVYSNVRCHSKHA